MDFPDIAHLKQLQDELWRWPGSRAAVMVGAGFSLNAEPLPGVHTRFPTWRELSRAMFDELHLSHPDETPEQKQERDIRFRGANPLRIASEFEAAFSRAKLDHLIMAQIPDPKYQPGRLHNLLLKLPWANVFTTNYDTLLERTEVAGRAYQPVTNASELLTAFAPRIVKLHGSLPSQTPLIITEEDYRTYPQRFAPFVNSVQQSLIENSFVLIGFSGDDPNFLEWTGWIRDELGGNHAPIYLVGPLSIEPAERALLARRGVTAIDLSPAFAGIQPPNGIHAASIEWFLNCLYASRPPRPENWPDLDRVPPPSPTGHPRVIDNRPPIPQAVGRSPRHGAPLDVNAVTGVLERWKFERQNYPGWLVATAGKRMELWEETKCWIDPLATFAAGRSARDRLVIFREIHWRLEVSMVPLFTIWLAPFENALDELFETLLEGQALSRSSAFIPNELASVTELADAWLEVALGFLRAARENYDDPRWSELNGRVDQLVGRYPQRADQAYYEAILWRVWNVDRASAKTMISAWQPSPRAPLAAIRKAGLLAELDELGEAKTILRAALVEIRRGLRSQGQSIELLSLEGWCTYLLFAVESASNLMRRSDVLEEFRERWEELKAWDCSPWVHREYFDEALAASPPTPQPEFDESRGFDRDSITVTHHYGIDNIAPSMPAFSYIRLQDTVGLPLRLPGVDIAGDRLMKACHWAAPFFIFGSVTLLVRAGRTDDIVKGDFLNRERVATMDSDLAERLYGWCSRCLSSELNSLRSLIGIQSAQQSILDVLPEVLSRLAFRVSMSKLSDGFPFALRVQRHFAVRSDITLHKSYYQWFRRMFEAADRELLIEWLPDLIKGPFHDEGVAASLQGDQGWPDPIWNLPSKRISSMRTTGIADDLRAKINEATNWLLTRTAGEIGERRRRAIARLVKIYETGLMTTEQQQKFGEVLWSKTNTDGLPDFSGFPSSFFLSLPAPKDVDVSSLVKRHILALTTEGAVSVDQLGRTTLMYNTVEQPLLLQASLASKPVIQIAGEPKHGVEWSQEEARQLYQMARTWWANDKKAFGPELSPSSDSWGNPVLRSLTRLGQLLSRAILSRMDWANEADWNEILAWLQEIRGLGAFPTLALPYVLLHRPSEADGVGATLRQDLDSENEYAVGGAALALRHWIGLSAARSVPIPRAELIEVLVERVAFRRKPGIDSCLGQTACLIVESHEWMTSTQADLLSASLIPWHRVTQLTNNKESGDEFPPGERPELQASVAGLAGALAIWHSECAPRSAEPPGVILWRELCKFSSLPEVRRAFTSRDHAAT